MEYANSNTTNFNLNYTGIVNYYYYDEYNNKVYLSFQCQNACFRIDSIGNIYWQSGIFLGGDWYNGQWKNLITNDDGQTWQQTEQIVSQFDNGIWHNGNFYKGIWHNGVFKSGNFYFGYFQDGIFGYNTLIDENAVANWYNGIFYGGVFAGSLWQTGNFYTNSNIKSYWLVRDQENINIWQDGYINDALSPSSPSKTLYNNQQRNNASGRITYLIIKEDSYQLCEFVCSNANFNVDYIGNIQILSGNYYNGVFTNINISNSTISGFQLTECVINNCNIINSTLLNCIVDNQSQNNISNCQWYNGKLSGGHFIQSTWYDGTFEFGYFQQSIWYNGQWNTNKNNYAYWFDSSQWYNGTWNGGFINETWSDKSPYIMGNGKSYESFSGQLLYKYNNKDYVIELQNASISIEVDGTILFNGGNWLDGIFNNGNFINAQFFNGEFNNGTFENSIWHNGNFNNGTFYSSVWKSGNFNNGIFQRSNWQNGYFINGQFKSGYWYNGNFNGGNWVTLNSFWFDGFWNGGLQNGLIPSNYSNRTFVIYLTQEDLTNNQYILQIKYDRYSIQLFDNDNNKINLQLINNYEQCENIGYYLNNSKIYLCFKNQIEIYYKITYTQILTDASPKIKYIDDYEQYLEKDVKNLISGEFTYIVENEDQEKEYYTIRVENANFSVSNGFITWNNGTFKDGIWYNGQWNTNDNRFLRFIQPLKEQLLQKLQKCIWQNGIWMNGNWNYEQSQWKNGEWLKGTINNISSNEPPKFQIGNGRNYTNYHGRLKYIYTDQQGVNQFGFLQLDDADLQILENGYVIVNKGNLINCYWYNGQWYGDNWYNGQWYNGIWNCGTWHNGTWHNGTWKISIIDYQNIERTQYRQGSYRNVGIRYVNSELDIPIRGFFLGETIQYDANDYSSSSNSDSSEYYDQWTDEQYENFYGNNLNNFSDNSDSSSSYQQNQQIAVLVKKWVDSKWIEGFIGNIKSFYPPMYGIANGNEYRDYTQDILYHYPVYNDKNIYLYDQYFLLICQNASFKVDKDGNIFWYGGNLVNSQWNNGVWNNGIFINGTWHNGTWKNGIFTAGTFQNGIWQNGEITTDNLHWINGQWRKGKIDGYKSVLSPALYTANNHLFINYTGVVKYYNIDHLQYYKIDVENACFFVSENGQVVFYNGTWNDGTFVGHWKTSSFDERFDYLLQESIIKIGKEYTYRMGSRNITYKIETIDNMFNGNDKLDTFQITNNGVMKEDKIFLETNNYISLWKFGTFSTGTWYNGEWIDGEWLTTDENQPIGKWVTGLINGFVEIQPPAYQIVSDTNDFYRFENFTGRIKYKVNFFNDQTLKIVQYVTTFSCKNAYFDIEYHNVIKKRKEYRKVIIKWYDGQWNSGTFHHGIWKKGIWHNGTWETGYWLDGTWETGTWISGVWYNGIWKSGTKKRMSILNMISY